MATTELPPSAAELEELDRLPLSTIAPTGAPAPRPASTMSVLRLPSALAGDSTRAVVLSWLVSRAITLALLVMVESTVVGDVSYYARSLRVLFHGGSIHQVLQEYPLPVMAIMLPPYLLGIMNPLAFGALFAASMLIVDAIFTWTLWRVGGRRRSEAVRFWLWFVPAVGPMAYFRFDLVPAMLAGAAVLAAARRPAWSGALTAIGASLKLWPALMLPSFLLRRLDRRPVLKGFFFTGLAIAGASFAVGGWSRLLSPLHWQSGRGLQIESVTATPLMLGWAVHPKGTWDIRISDYKAYEIYGPGVHGFITASSIFTILGLAFLGFLWYRARMLPSVSAETVAWLFLATAAMVTITNKTLSPQYILWLGGPLAALLARWPGDPYVRRAARLLLIICVLTQIVFPLTYNHLTNGDEASLPTMLVLTLRNVLLVTLTWIACFRVLHQTGQDDTPEEPAPKAAASDRVG